MSARILVSIVTYNSGRFLRHCLSSLKNQTYRDFMVSIWDNASGDETPEIAAEYSDFVQTMHFSSANLGFCAAHNRVIGESGTEYVLVLNPDVVLESRFLETMIAEMDAEPTAGSASGKLYRWASEHTPVGANTAAGNCRVLDSTGIYLTSNQRHLDRGSGEQDVGRYDRIEYVFGASGAAAFYRSRMLEEAKTGSEYFDEAFFAYREDADLAWRAQWLGWRCLYVPLAVGYHARLVMPARRSILPPDINMHSFKNRFLLRVKNLDTGTYGRLFLQITLRDIAAFVYVLACERSSLRGIPLFFKALPRAWSFRRALRNHRKVQPREIRSWFSRRSLDRPASIQRVTG